MFPMLAEKMPAFADELQMPDQHHKIHGGLIKFRDYLWDVAKGKEGRNRI
jgi:hypothetical protein